MKKTVQWVRNYQLDGCQVLGPIAGESYAIRKVSVPKRLNGRVCLVERYQYSATPKRREWKTPASGSSFANAKRIARAVLLASNL